MSWYLRAFIETALDIQRLMASYVVLCSSNIKKFLELLKIWIPLLQLEYVIQGKLRFIIREKKEEKSMIFCFPIHISSVIRT